MQARKRPIKNITNDAQPLPNKENHKPCNDRKRKPHSKRNEYLQNQNPQIKSQQHKSKLDKRQKRDQGERHESVDEWNQRKKQDRHSNPVLAYQHDILSYLSTREKKTMIDHHYTKLHRNFTPSIRTFLIKYLYRIYHKLKLQRVTLFYAISYLDHYLQNETKISDQSSFICIAQTALFIAMKYSEIYPPLLEEWTDVRHQYQIFQMQARILKAIDFNLEIASPQYYLQYYAEKLKMNQYFSRERCEFLIDLAMFDLPIHKFSPKMLVRAIIRITSDMRSRGNLEQYEEVLEGPIDDQMEKCKVNVRWMIQRNTNIIRWLQEHKYVTLNFV